MMRAQSLIAQWADDVSLPGACRALTETMAPAPRNDDVCGRIAIRCLTVSHLKHFD